ncbi:MAG: methyltransferase domain-containing protein [Candidatus Limnocylindria bacterium]
MSRVRSSLADLLVDPVTGGDLRMEAEQTDDRGDVIEGRLLGKDGIAYPVRDGIPRFVGADGPDSQVAASFGYKWSQRSSYQAPKFATWYRSWLLEKYGFSDEARLRTYFSRFQRVLEVGCGSGMSSVISLDGLRADQHWLGLDLSTAIDVARERLGGRPNTEFVQADALALPFREGTFDAVFSEGVLHHTPSTRAALASVVSILSPGGEVMFYVYRVKAPLREYTDDMLRDRLSGLPPAEAWEMMAPLTGLAKALADLHATVQVPEDVPLLGIKAGTYDVQRLIYWHFAKLFWSDDLGFEGSQHVNFDWYHPRFAHRHSEDEVRGWCEELRLSIVHFDVQDSGFTVRAVKG